MNIKEIQQLVGAITQEQLRNVECFCSTVLGIFIPAVGPCFYSITPEHTHPAYSFILTSDDNCKIQIDGRTIDGVSGTLNAISPNVAHHEILTEEFSRYAAIMIDAGFFEEQLLDYTKDLPLFAGNMYQPQDSVRSSIKEFIVEHEHNLPGRQQILQAVALKLTHAIIRSVLTIEEPHSKVSKRMDIDRVVDYMHRHYSDDITVEELAESIDLSKAHFSRMFKAETGVAPLELLITIRLKYAKKLLALENASITDIAYKCGFNSSSHFTATFNKKYHMSPSQYKKFVVQQKS